MATTEPASPQALVLATLLRAAPFIAVGLVITFTADHSARTGLLALGALGVTSALALGAGSVRLAAGEPVRALHGGLAVIALVTGAAALVAANVEAALAFLLLITGGFAVLSGAVELVWGIRRRGSHPLARDAIAVGAGTLALALVFAVVADPVSAVGLIGAYAIVVGVYLVIAALSLTRGTAQKENTPS